MIIPSNSPHVERTHEQYGIHDARTMSPRRTSEEIEKMGNEARQAMIEYVFHPFLIVRLRFFANFIHA